MACKTIAQHKNFLSALLCFVSGGAKTVAGMLPIHSLFASFQVVARHGACWQMTK
jgi:hypothetical protein